jgi:hypothetical protein
MEACKLKKVKVFEAENACLRRMYANLVMDLAKTIKKKLLSPAPKERYKKKLTLREKRLQQSVLSNLHQSEWYKLLIYQR